MQFGSSSRPRQSVHGFALLITITLLAFLVLLLVSLASLTRVETQVASNAQQISQARQNALMALNVALGQLQRAAGPDQRVTATADLASGDANGNRVADGAATDTTVGATKYWDATSTPNGLGKVRAGTRYWTGVWGNADPSTPTSGNGNIYEKTPRPVLLNWLVSGNETATFTAVTSGTVTATTSVGQITAANGTLGVGSVAPVYSPATALSSGAITSSTKATDSLAYSATVGAVLLVGPGTAGTSSRTVPYAEPAEGRYVVAPLVPIKSSAVPGLSGEQTIGRYAWWVGDEGVKARLNLVDPNAANTDAATDVKARYRLMVAPRSGVEVSTDFNANSTISATYPNWSQSTAANPSLKRVLGLPQAGLMDSTNIVFDETGATHVRMAHHVHDFTTTSVGLEADTYNGGLRKDLTYEFEQSTLPTWTGTNNQPSGTGRSIIPATSATTYSPYYNSATYVPQWDILHNFYNLATTANSGTVTMQAATTTKMGITPVISQIKLTSGFYTDTTTVNARVVSCPLFVLSNPYSVDIKSSGDLYLKFNYNHTESNPAIYYRVAWSSFSKTVTPWLIGPNKGGLIGNVIFKIPGPITIPSGSSKVYTMNSLLDVTSAATGGASITANLSEGAPSATTFNGVYCSVNIGSPTGTKIDQIRMGENSQTTWIEVAMSNNSAFSDNLQTVSGLNLDLPYVGINNITTAGSWPADIIPCSTFAFDLNLPGQNNYGTTDGTKNTTLRTYADFNVRGSFFRFAKRQYTVAPYHWRTSSSSEMATQSPFFPLKTFTDDTTSLYWGRATTVADANNITRAVFFDLPRRASSTEMPILSLGQLQHANVTADSVQLNVTHQPGYAIGNSYQSPLIDRAVSSESCWDSYWKGNNSQFVDTLTSYYDISYLLNASLWDGYFFSSIPQSSAAQAPANSRLQSINAATDNRNVNAAENLCVEGAFNINSTSVDAWASVLGGMNKLPALSGNDTSSATNTVTLSRSIRQPGGWANAADGSASDAYIGFRKLTVGQVQALATAIVAQVRQRGPFVSLAHFINRTLVSAASDTNGVGLSGPLQRAIDSGTTINNLTFGTTNTTDTATLPANNNPDNPSGLSPRTLGVYSLFYPTQSTTSGLTVADGAYTYANSGLTKLTDKRSTAIPGWLTQADVLQAIGPILSARSDTFVIRTYGETLDPIQSTATTPVVIARAWCEAVVQRMPDYVDANSNSASVAPSTANTLNQTFGRRFKVVSFRWIGPNDI